MSERDELARILNGRGAYCGSCDYEEGNCSDCDNVLADYADAILAAGYRKPRTITTADELCALPLGSVVKLVDRGYVYERTSTDRSFEDDDWTAVGGYIMDFDWLPATVLWEPR